jgi:hypothetical protein
MNKKSFKNKLKEIISTTENSKKEILVQTKVSINKEKAIVLQK